MASLLVYHKFSKKKNAVLCYDNLCTTITPKGNTIPKKINVP